MLEHTKRQVKVFFPAFKNEKRLFPYVYHRSLFFVSPYMFLLLLLLLFFFFSGGEALLGERVKGQISRVIPAMVTSK